MAGLAFATKKSCGTTWRCLKDGECISDTGTHLGHNLPDKSGNRYCINLVSVAGNPEE